MTLLKSFRLTPNALWWQVTLAAALCIPAFFIHLGITPLIEDEATRALVTFEMDKSGNFWVPTVGGSNYYNKPPLFNWILFPFFHFGGYNEWMLRIPVVLSLLLFAFTIWATTREYIGNRVAFYTSLAFLTCGRVLFYESLKGLIDIVFCWALFTNFMVLYKAAGHPRQRWYYLASYALLASAFLLKGLPAIVFQVLTLVGLGWLKGRLQGILKLINLPHLAGGALFVILMAGYYALYEYHNPGSLTQMAEIMFQQSARRTGLRFGLMDTLWHIAHYPFELLFHFLPWSVLAVLLFSAKAREYVSRQAFLVASLVILVLNLIPYWTSPESFPRYILMLVPMAFSILIVLANWFIDNNLKFKSRLNILLQIVLLLSATLWLALPCSGVAEFVSGVWVKSIALAAASVGLWLLLQKKSNPIFVALIFMLVTRVGFNLFVLTHRMGTMQEVQCREQAQKAGKKLKGKTIYAFGAPYRDFNEDTTPKYISYSSRFYIASEADGIIRNSKLSDSSSYFIVPQTFTTALPTMKVAEFCQERHQVTYKVIRFVVPMSENRPLETSPPAN